MASTNGKGQISGGDGPESPSKLNLAAKPFTLPLRRINVVAPSNSQGDSNGNSKGSNKIEEIAYIGPTHLPVNTRVWNSISSYSLEDIARTGPSARPTQSQIINVFPSNSAMPASSCLKSPFQQPTTQSTQFPFGPILLDNGVIQLRLRDSITVDMTADASVKVVNGNHNIAIAISSDTLATAMHHPNGIVFQNGPRVDIAAVDARRKYPYIRFAKMWHKGISLTSTRYALIYLVDSAGTRTTSDMISMDMEADYVNQVFFNGVVPAAHNYIDQWQIIQNSSYQLGQEGSLQFQVNGFRITQGGDGLVKIYRSNNRCSIRTSPTNGCATVTTNSIHCTASLGTSSHLFVRREERRMHFDGATFIVRNAGHSAGFDELDRLRVY
ncbi:uncharacterized protein LOC126561215 [Anopheles maculipalpis]|uniref:uncharacterized protein LOC126561215 n=1 Tax=Anopheles maculipalpis TaxID=1496333 RepID=UPI0021594F04|nr:uncharacterized protein LOC126561215 [Anopheles maculipalpis]